MRLEFFGFIASAPDGNPGAVLGEQQIEFVFILLRSSISLWVCYRRFGRFSAYSSGGIDDVKNSSDE